MYNTGKPDAPASPLASAAILIRFRRLWRLFRCVAYAHAYAHAYVDANRHADVDTQSYADPDAATPHSQRADPAG